ncbi:MAG: hypothetical protein JXR96_12760 [Deltaproteobacteria bacterium]|nr:hypothetical protein [Deltaproteobacteria bacterium]
MRSSRQWIPICFALAALVCSSQRASAQNTRVCVEVVLVEAAEEQAQAPVIETPEAKPAEPEKKPETTAPGEPRPGAEPKPDQEPASEPPARPWEDALGKVSALDERPEHAQALKPEEKPTDKSELKGKRYLQVLEEQAEAWRGFLPIGQTPTLYLRRLIEHFITHEQGFAAVRENCQETLRVELYPLQSGWTVFARYSGHDREERVDELQPDELSRFAERAVSALLADVPISATINRDTVLRSDSKQSTQRIKGSNHFFIGLGTQVRGGQFETTATRDSTDPDYGSTESQLRLFFPMSLEMGYRGKFENWGIESKALVGISTSKTASRHNSQGGHIDFGGDVGLQLHFLRYLNPRGLHSIYLGAGASFELLWFSAIKAEGSRGESDRSTLLGGGLDVDLIAGWEFMRASTVQFFLQAELNLPAYGLENEDNHGALHTWFPGLSVKLGMMF